MYTLPPLQGAKLHREFLGAWSSFPGAHVPHYFSVQNEALTKNKWVHSLLSVLTFYCIY